MDAQSWTTRREGAEHTTQLREPVKGARRRRRTTRDRSRFQGLRASHSARVRQRLIHRSMSATDLSTGGPSARGRGRAGHDGRRRSRWTTRPQLWEGAARSWPLHPDRETERSWEPGHDVGWSSAVRPWRREASPVAIFRQKVGSLEDLTCQDGDLKST